MIFSNIESLVRTGVVGVLAYIALILLLRISGHRTLSKMNAFDFVITVALGSTLATALLSKSVSLTDGVLAFVVLIGLQFIVTWTSVRVSWVQKMVSGEPFLLFYRNRFLSQNLKKARVTEDEVLAAIRGAGIPAVEEVDAVILETDGSFSVIGKAKNTPLTSIKGVRE